MPARKLRRHQSGYSGEETTLVTDILVFLPFPLALGLGFFVRRRRGWIALTGVPIALALWAIIEVTGGFDDDPEGTAAYLSLVFVVPVYAAIWAAAVGTGYVARKLFW